MFQKIRYEIKSRGCDVLCHTKGEARTDPGQGGGPEQTIKTYPGQDNKDNKDAITAVTDPIVGGTRSPPTKRRHRPLMRHGATRRRLKTSAMLEWRTAYPARWAATVA